MAQTNRTQAQARIARGIAIGRNIAKRRDGRAEAVEAVLVGHALQEPDGYNQEEPEVDVVELVVPMTLHYVDRIDQLGTKVTTLRYETIAALIEAHRLDQNKSLAESIAYHGPETVYATLDPFHQERGRRYLVLASSMELLQEAHLRICDSI